MVAPRGTTDAVDPVLTAPLGASGLRADRIARLAQRWVGLAPHVSPAVARRLQALLRRLVSVIGAEPFTATAARSIGADLFASGLVDEAGPAEDLLPECLALLRSEVPAIIGPAEVHRAERLASALDEVAAGFARAFAERGAQARHPESLPACAAGGIGAWHYRAAFDQAAVPIALVSLDGTSIVGNRALSDLVDMGDPQRPWSDFVHPDDLAEVIGFRDRLALGEPDVMRIDIRLVQSDASMLWVHVVGSMVRRPDGTPSHLMTVIEDVSERKLRSSRLAHAAGRDQLTRLPGEAQAEKWMHRVFHGDAATVAVCAVDLDGFATIVDAVGTAAADRLLLAVAGRLQLVAGSHLLTRAGIDEFLVLLADPDRTTDAVRMADQLIDALAVPFEIDHRSVTVTASIGVAQAATTGTTAAELTRAAAIAASWAKSLGGARRVVFDHRRDAGEAARFSLLSGLRPAIGRGEFRLVYQPLVALDDHTLRGAEALVRWQHPDEGLIGPSRFIELAEQSGAIVPLGRWVLEEACAQAALWWRELGADAPYVSVNVSPVQMAAPEWVDEVTDVLAATGLPPRKLQLEITEQAVLVDETTAMTSLAALADAGVRLALDDFGTGYSSFTWLRRLPVHALKIDGSFIDGLRHPSPDLVDRSIVRALVDMAHALGLEVTAEWVETPLQAQRLTALGCDAGQGRWFGDPGPGRWVPDEFRRRLGP